MFFTKLARILAIGALVLGVASILIGLATAMELVMPYDAAVARYGLSAAHIDRGIYAVFVAAALGTLAEISVWAHNRP